jgi:hypothetical protein
MSKKWRHLCLSPVPSSVNWWTHVGALIYFLRAKVTRDIHESNIITFWTSVFAVVIDTPLHALHILNLLLRPLMGCNWLFILYRMSVNTYVLSDVLQSEISPSQTGSNFNSIILPLFSLLFWIQSCIFWCLYWHLQHDLTQTYTF